MAFVLFMCVGFVNFCGDREWGLFVLVFWVWCVCLVCECGVIGVREYVWCMFVCGLSVFGVCSWCVCCVYVFKFVYGVFLVCIIAGVVCGDCVSCVCFF